MIVQKLIFHLKNIFPLHVFVIDENVMRMYNQLNRHTRDGKVIKSLDIKMNKDELICIILIDRRSNFTDDTYLERTSY
jgi:hypothetical protein